MPPNSSIFRVEARYLCDPLRDDAESISCRQLCKHAGWSLQLLHETSHWSVTCFVDDLASVLINQTHQFKKSVCMYICIMYVASLCVCTYVCICVCIYIYIYIYISLSVSLTIYIYIYAHVCICMYVCMYIYIYIYIYNGIRGSGASPMSAR